MNEETKNLILRLVSETPSGVDWRTIARWVSTEAEIGVPAKEVAFRLGISMSRFYALKRVGKIPGPAMQIGKRRFWNRIEVEAICA